MEALPYRKDDAVAGYESHYAEIADTGYVSCRLDIRGTGSSGGITTDEYSAEERRDLVEVIDWLATQDWSSGNVGMFGTSYGGFNSLQAALENPPALKAIVPIFASDDRYDDDVHYYGGALKHVDLVDYPTYMVAMNALPPVPGLWGEDWRDEWQRRLERTEPWVLTWLAHQRRDDYWRYGSVREDIASIRAATMIVGGWADGYTNIALRSFERMQAPVRLLIGPWSHGSPESCRARTEHRRHRRDPSVVRPMAEGDRQRDRPRATDRGLPTALDRARPVAERGPRCLARRADVAAGATPHARPRPRRRRTRRRRRRGPDRRAHGRRRCRGHRVDLVRRRTAVGSIGRPASGRGALADLHLGAARRGA